MNHQVRVVLSGFVLPLMIAGLLFAALVYFVFPTTTWMTQRADALQADERIEALHAEQDWLRVSISRLRTDAEIERIARSEYNLVFPGEEAYALLPAPPAPIVLPTSWPFTILYDDVG